MLEAFSNNPYIAKIALARISRDKEYIAKWGRRDRVSKNARAIIAEGGDWPTRLRKALREGKISLPVAMGLLSGEALREEPQQ